MYPPRTKDTEYLSAPILKPYGVVMTADAPTGTDVNAAPDIKPALDVTPKENPRFSLASTASSTARESVEKFSGSGSSYCQRFSQ